MGQWGGFRVKNATLCLQIHLGHLLLFLIKKNCLSIIFISCFDEVSNFPNRILTSQKAQLVIKNCQWNCMLWNKENNFAFISHRTATARKGSYAAIYKR